MAKKSMTLYEALAKKKILADRVEKCANVRMCAIKKKSDDMTTDDMTIDDAEKSIRSNYASAVSLMNNFTKLSMAINYANAITKVTIAGNEYTIADAIVRYRHLQDEEKIYMRMLSNLAACKQEIENNRNRYLTPEKISDYVSKVLGDSKKDDVLVQKTTDTYVNNWALELYDPMDTETLANTKLEEIAEFRENIHAALTQVNCTTTIEVDFED